MNVIDISTVRIPSISHLQWAFLRFVQMGGASAPATKVQRAMAMCGCPKGPAFYQLAKRLVKMGMVVAEHRIVAIEWAEFVRTEYLLTKEGDAALQNVKDFYGKLA